MLLNQEGIYMGKRKKSQKNKEQENIKRKQQIDSQTAILKAEMENERVKGQLKQERIERKFHIFLIRGITLLKRIGLGVFVAIIIGAIVSLGGLIILYLKFDTNTCPMTTKLFNIVQLLSGIVSVVVGIWALILAYKARSEPYGHELHISKLVVATDSLDGYTENDIKSESLG